MKEEPTKPGSQSAGRKSSTLSSFDYINMGAADPTAVQVKFSLTKEGTDLQSTQRTAVPSEQVSA